MRSPFRLPVALLLVTALMLTSCGGDGTPPADGQNNTAKDDSRRKNDPSSILKVGDKLFNLPSPLETAMLIEEVGGHFNESILNPNTDATNYSVKDIQAMNLGVYGADLGYCLIYSQSQKAFSLLATCKKLGTELGISPAMYTGLIQRFEGNLENKDSLLIFISELNRMSDEYLKENESEDISAMILYGGWVESLYFVTELSKSLKDERLMARVGEQKNTLENLIGLINQENTDGRFDGIIANLKDLQASFAKVQTTYTWQEPETNAEEKLTVIKSKSSVQMSEELLFEISDKVAALRNEIISISAS